MHEESTQQTVSVGTLVMGIQDFASTIAKLLTHPRTDCYHALPRPRSDSVSVYRVPRVDHVRTLHPAVAECAIWTSSTMDSGEYPVEQVAGLWRTPEKLRMLTTAAMAKTSVLQPPPLVMKFAFHQHDFGPHPSLKRCAESWMVNLGGVTASALSTCSQITRSEWEDDTLLSAAMIVSMTQRPITVVGMQRTPQMLLEHCNRRFLANCNMLPLLEDAWKDVVDANCGAPPR